MTSTDTMGRYADGDASAFEELYAELSPIVLRCQIRWVGDWALAEELTQDTFLRVHRARSRYRRGAPVKPWILTIARRLSIDALRRRGKAKVRLSWDGELSEIKVEAQDDDGPTAEIMSEVRAAVDALPDSQRSVVSMHKLDGLPFAEVAASLGISEAAARVRAHRGYGRLRTALGHRSPLHRGSPLRDSHAG